MIMSRLAPRAGGGSILRRSRRVRLSRPICVERCSRTDGRMSGGLGGKGGISCNARMGEIGVGGSGSSTCRYHGSGSGGGDEVD